DQVDLVTVERYGSPESVRESEIESATCYDSSTFSVESIPESPATSSLQSFEFEPEVEQVDDMYEVQQVDEVEEMSQMDEMEEVEQADKEEEVERVQVEEEEELEQVEEVEEEYQEDQEEQEEQEDQLNQVNQEDQLDHGEQEDHLDQVEEESLSSSSVAASINDELLQQPPSIALYINKRELELMKKFREQLEDKTRMLQDGIKNLQDTLEMMTEQFRRMQDSSFQIQPTMSYHIDCPEPQSLEPMPKKPRTEKMEGLLPDFKETSLSCGSCLYHYFQFPEELEEPCNVSNQGQEQYLQQQLQEIQEQHMQQQILQEQSQQHNATVGNQTLKTSLPNQADMAMPLCDDPITFMQNQPTVVPVQLVAGQQPSDGYQDENLGDHEDNSQSFLPKDQQGSPMNSLLLVYTPSSEAGSSTSCSESSINSDSNIVTSETSKDYIQLWQQPPDPQYHLYFQENTCPSSEQASLQDQAIWTQVPATEVGIQGFPDSEASQDSDELTPGQINYFMSAE
ncbi:circadian clock protein PASD1, partial [Crocuta crocuta]